MVDYRNNHEEERINYTQVLFGDVILLAIISTIIYCCAFVYENSYKSYYGIGSEYILFSTSQTINNCIDMFFNSPLMSFLIFVLIINHRNSNDNFIRRNYTKINIICFITILFISSLSISPPFFLINLYILSLPFLLFIPSFFIISMLVLYRKIRNTGKYFGVKWLYEFYFIKTLKNIKSFASPTQTQKRLILVLFIFVYSLFTSVALADKVTKERINYLILYKENPNDESFKCEKYKKIPSPCNAKNKNSSDLIGIAVAPYKDYYLVAKVSDSELKNKKVTISPEYTLVSKQQISEDKIKLIYKDIGKIKVKK
ncbi:hypothetical protein SAMN05444487_102127 [Marininema mesophilum]|uniref:Uncharacterized protein n=1 Tax=Marininema mesophilum TaxID=1048340 RepID=A0A1H2S7V0_9BACL|nr:hypothetical protein [Marininema mesophilum]SDW27608.1 hypothetical protein SAMN05444487_102127 [Marininema mesophilum]